ncbi:hypothetical protein D5085_03685 [Ectothiorhodospiraceae bacterium BW-2]|nr:hypothetical protein D5085_03685 [Ectothiorhodospiraceae bacterium BW-2]
MFTTALCATLEQGLNALLRLEPELHQQLAELEGRTLHLKLQGVALSATLRFGHRIEILCHDDGLSDVTLSGPPLALLRLMQQRPGSELFGSGAVDIQGDVALVQQLQQMIDRADIDLEEWLSHLLGDAPAHTLGRMTRSVTRWLAQSYADLRYQSEQYLHHETEQLPLRWEVDQFIDAVDKLRNDTDRLEARLNHYLSKG